MVDSKNIVLQPKEISFKRKYMKIKDLQYGNYRIPYEEIVLAYLSAEDAESGGYYKPGIADITRDMDGDLVLYGCRRDRFTIHTDLLKETAGVMLEELAIRAPYILVGAQDWFDEEDEEQFSQIGEMVEIMRGCT